VRMDEHVGGKEGNGRDGGVKRRKKARERNRRMEEIGKHEDMYMCTEEEGGKTDSQ